jgi:hypothetical protein
MFVFGGFHPAGDKVEMGQRISCIECSKVCGEKKFRHENGIFRFE